MNRVLLLAGGLVAVILLVVGLLFFVKSSKVHNLPGGAMQSTLSGSLDLNGYIPQNSYVRVQAKQLPNGQYETVVDSIAARNGASWTFGNAVRGETYQLQAQLMVNNSVSDSSPVTVTVAPAGGVVLRINSTNQPAATFPTTTAISGTFNLNGYLPQGSTVSISVQKQGDQEYKTVVTNVAAKDGGSWTWDTAETGQTYNLKASLLSSSGSPITSSSSQVVTAPATEELITINSTATPPAPQVVGISGAVTFNGNMPSNPTFSLGVRKTGTQNFANTVSGQSVSQGMTWTYNSAIPGVSYDIQGYLWSNGQPYSQSQVLTVSAPATGETLTINAQTQPQAPNGGTLNVSCGNQQNNLYQVTVNFNTSNNLSQAQQYQVSIGSTSGASDMYNSTVSPSNPNNSQSLTTNYLFSKAVNYYAQYSYSTCQGGNCSTFSNSSPAVSFNCQ